MGRDAAFAGSPPYMHDERGLRKSTSPGLTISIFAKKRSGLMPGGWSGLSQSRVAWTLPVQPDARFARRDGAQHHGIRIELQ